MKYLLDTSALIDSHRKYYSSCILPSFWSFLDDKMGIDTFSIEEVFDEISRGGDKDHLKIWAKKHKCPEKFLSCTDKKLKIYSHQ